MQVFRIQYKFFSWFILNVLQIPNLQVSNGLFPKLIKLCFQASNLYILYCFDEEIQSQEALPQHKIKNKSESFY
jgi:hypothetical protein